MTERTDPNEPTVAGLTKQYIDAVLEKQGWLRFTVGRYDSDRPGNEESRNKLFAQIGRLIEWLDLTESWPTQATAVSHGLEMATVKDDGKPTHPTPAEAFFDLTLWSLDIESEESGYADATLTLDGNDTRLRLIGNGDFWIEEQYTHRTTGHVLYGAELTYEEMAELNGNRDYIHDGEVAFSLLFEALIEQ